MAAIWQIIICGYGEKGGGTKTGQRKNRANAKIDKYCREIVELNAKYN